MEPDDAAVVILLTASYGWIPPQVKAVFAERDGVNLTVHLGCDVEDERVRDAAEDIGVDAHGEAGESWNVVVRTHEAPDIGDWRARGWLPIHLAAEWGRGWVEHIDQFATGDAPPEWTPDRTELARSEFHTRPANLPGWIELKVLAALAQAAAGQVTPIARAVHVLMSESSAEIYWHLDTPPDDVTARAMNVAALRLRERCDRLDSLNFLEIEQRWYVHDPNPPRTARWDLFFKRDDSRTWAERDATDVGAPGE